MLTRTHTSVFPASRAVVLAVVSLCLLVSSVAAVEDDQDILSRMRAERRASIRQASLNADKSGSSHLFGLLVIPVDFADARLPEDWDPGALNGRLTSPAQESITRYFDVASRGLLDIRVTQAPVIHLPGTRRDYSDVGFNGYTRTRQLATESLEAVKALGLEFRRLDMDGPDNIPGTIDDDGVVDGVLILHAGSGQENDPADGLIQALQFFLAEPVVSAGVNATFYAVASLQSGPGIWAHETAHLLGLEDRYDPSLRPTGGSEVLSRGGLGRFSLMASGAWGTGDGYGAALPDAYSSSLLGWYGERNLHDSGSAPDTLRAGITSGSVDRLWTQGMSEPEFFLLETRDPEVAYPFDANIPSHQLLIYHIDETLAEGQATTDGSGERHLRASLVEADNDFKLRNGENQGVEDDFFPGPLGIFDFDPSSVPSSDGYHAPSLVSLNSITPVDGGVAYSVSVYPSARIAFEAGFTGSGGESLLDVSAWDTGSPVSALTCIVSVGSSPAWGTFADGQLSAALDFFRDPMGTWRPFEPVPWFPSADLPPDAATSLSFDFTLDGAPWSQSRTWYWKDNASVLDFDAGPWPGPWTISGPTFDTYWHRWSGPPWLTEDQTPVLACTGFEFPSPALWPDVNYANSSTIELTSAPLGPEVQAVRLIHAMEVEYLTAAITMDGGTVSWVGPDDNRVEAEPLSGWRGRISPQAVNDLHGQEALVMEGLELENDIPLWRTDIVPLPTGSPGPWRLRLSFGTNSLWRYRGWFVAAVDPVFSEPATAGFSAQWDGSPGGGLSWSWPWSRDDSLPFQVQIRRNPETPWETAAEGVFPPEPGSGGYFLSATDLLAELTGPPFSRFEVRVLGHINKGRVATRGIVVFPDGGDGQTITLGLPWPNPAHESVRFMVGIPAGGQGSVGVFDLRGRRLLEIDLGAGDHLMEWDGNDSQGARAPSGTYIIRLDGSGSPTMRKVVLIH